MSPNVILPASIALSLISFGLIAKWYVFPPLTMLDRADGQLGATYFIPAMVVPALLVNHCVVFALLLRRQPTLSSSPGGVRVCWQESF